jgi:D-beta-D-heptose 7-phosphate kinase/D-beta-D-heptose 1-phosphate adenosyltransferase
MTPLYQPAMPLYRPMTGVSREHITNPHLIVVGDLFLAEHSCGLRSDEQAVPQFATGTRRDHRLARATHICQIMRDLDATVSCIGMVGNDTTGWELRRHLNACGITDQLVTIDTTRATNFRQYTHTLQRTSAVNPVPIDEQETTGPLTLEFQTQLREILLNNISVHDALVITDDSSDLCQDGLIRDVFTKAQQHDTPVIIAARGNHTLGRYRKAALVQLNRYGAELTTGKPINTPQDALRAGTQICQRYHLAKVIITFDHTSLIMTDAEGNGNALSTQSANATDRTGIDAKVLAVMGISLAHHADAGCNAQLTNLRIGLEATCLRPSRISDATSRQQPVTCATRHHPKILTVPELIQKLDQRRKNGQTIVFTNGCFDLLHAGHIACLTEAASLGDVLIVGMNSDTSVCQLKGPHRPRISEGDRATVLAAQESVDYVTIFDENTPLDIISVLRPDVLVKGGTYAIEEVVGKEAVESYGGKVAITGTIDGISTTRILESMQSVEPESARNIHDLGVINQPGVIGPVVMKQQRERAPTCCEELMKMATHE